MWISQNTKNIVEFFPSEPKTRTISLGPNLQSLSLVKSFLFGVGTMNSCSWRGKSDKTVKTGETTEIDIYSGSPD